MPYSKKSELPKGVKNNLPDHAQQIFLKAFNNAYKEYKQSELKALKVAWGAVKNAGYKKNKQGEWVQATKDRITTPNYNETY